MAGSDNDKLEATMTTGKSKQKKIVNSLPLARDNDAGKRQSIKVKQRNKNNNTPPSGCMLYCTHNGFQSLRCHGPQILSY